MENIIEQKIETAYRERRRAQDSYFWTTHMPIYFHLLTSQYLFWNFNSISEEYFLKNVDTGDVLLFRCESSR